MQKSQFISKKIRLKSFESCPCEVLSMHGELAITGLGVTEACVGGLHQGVGDRTAQLLHQ